VQGADSFPEGRPKAGLHKRSAEDKGAPCARERRSLLVGSVTLLCAERVDCFGALRGVPAEGVREDAGCIGGWTQGETSPLQMLVRLRFGV